MIAPWVEEEMESVDIGDERLDVRVAKILTALGNRPNLSIPAACGGRAEMEAAYRFFDNAKATFEKVLKPHMERTRAHGGAAGGVVGAGHQRDGRDAARARSGG